MFRLELALEMKLTRDHVFCENFKGRDFRIVTYITVYVRESWDVMTENRKGLPRLGGGVCGDGGCPSF